jgi:hypothetical protein
MESEGLVPPCRHVPKVLFGRTERHFGPLPGSGAMDNFLWNWMRRPTKLMSSSLCLSHEFGIPQFGR